LSEEDISTSSRHDPTGSHIRLSTIP
ncbi:hypothetical protein MGSAQ_002850, partial [marine sediment metagenome]